MKLLKIYKENARLKEENELLNKEHQVLIKALDDDKNILEIKSLKETLKRKNAIIRNLRNEIKKMEEK